MVCRIVQEMKSNDPPREGSGVASKHLTWARCRTAKGVDSFDHVSLDALALILLAVSVSKSKNGSAHLKNGMSNC